jgi:hypothetical protein
LQLFDQYIEPTAANLDRFAPVTNINGTDFIAPPENVFAAADVYGDPIIHCFGSKSNFIVNRGTGGNFSVQGTIDDLDDIPQLEEP